MKDKLQGRHDPKKPAPLTAWKEEQAEKTAERTELYRRYGKLKEEIQNVETLKRVVDQIPKPGALQAERSPSRSHVRKHDSEI
jgi:hypothetical protein